ncbi:hypothetical protein ACTMTF_15345 [Nonomuraea sp. ZG12]|uniref:hypothetical protein n=1 Tax=Nonomuraea sp. ZG12 TaxID=3452207 RepID=UPI003F8A763C
MGVLKDFQQNHPEYFIAPEDVDHMDVKPDPVSQHLVTQHLHTRINRQDTRIAQLIDDNMRLEARVAKLEELIG